MKFNGKKLWQETRSLLLFVVLMVVFRSAFADWNAVPTGSMKPTIVEGDRILVNKMAYDIRLPFSHISLYKIDDPLRGDIIVFDSEAADKKLVKRVVGIPGDLVQMQDNVLFINGQQLQYQLQSSNLSHADKQEQLLGVKHMVRVNHKHSPLANFAPIRVPQDHYLALGDNRDKSSDSRVIGFVPRNEIVGRSSSVVMSLDYDNYYLPRMERFFQTL